MAQLLTWLFIVTVGAWGATFVTCNFILMATDCERPRWYIALMRKIGRRIGWEMERIEVPPGSVENVGQRMTPTGHSMLLGALLCGDRQALAFLAGLPERTQRRIKHEVQALQQTHYRGRPLAFLTAAQRAEVGRKISQGLRRYYARWRA